MDRLELKVQDTHPETSFPGKVVVPWVNGSDLRDLVRPVEDAQGAGPIAGQYDGLPVTEVRSPTRYFLGHVAEPPQAGKVPVLGCRCGIVECWPMLVRITVSEDVVTWSEFEQPHRNGESASGEWSYAGLGPFRFDRATYEGEVGRLGRTLGRIQDE